MMERDLVANLGKGKKATKKGDEKLRCEGNDFPLTINKPLPVVLILVYTPGTKIVVSRMWNQSEYCILH